MAEVVYALSPVQQDVLRAIVAQIQAWREENRREAAAPGRGGSRPGAHRRPRAEHPRVLLLDGDRGAGKTSLMLTLIEGWYAGRGTDFTRDPATLQLMEEVKAGLESDWILPTVDFDPLPEGMPVYVWLLSAFVEYCSEIDGQTKPRPGERTLQRQLQDLQQTAILGWEPEQLEGSTEDRLVTRYQQMRNWHDFRGRWCAFVDALLSAASHAPRGRGLLIIPVDDLDLRSNGFREVVLALRQLNHPRVAFLACGYSAHMERTLAREIARGAVASEERERAALDLEPGGSLRLARSILDKQIPARMRFEMPAMTLSSAVNVPVRSSLGEGTSITLEELMNVGPTVGSDHFTFTSRRMLGRPTPVTYRMLVDVVHSLERVQQPVTMAGAEALWTYRNRLGVLLRVLRHPRAPWRVQPNLDGTTPWTVEGNPAVRETRPLEFVHLQGNLFRAQIRQFRYLALPEDHRDAQSVDEIGMEAAIQGAGPLRGVVGRGDHHSHVGTDPWTYSWFGEYAGESFPWPTMPSRSRAMSRPTELEKPISSERDSGYEAIASWLENRWGPGAALEVPRAALWDLLDQAFSRVLRNAPPMGSADSEAQEFTFVDSDEVVEAIGVLVLPESGLPLAERALLAAWLGRRRPLRLAAPMVEAERAGRFRWLELDANQAEGIRRLDAEDLVMQSWGRATSATRGGELADLLNISWAGGGVRDLLSDGANATQPGLNTFLTSALSRLLESPVDDNAIRGSLARYRAAGDARSRVLLRAVWDTLCELPQRWRDVFGPESGSVPDRAAEVVDALSSLVVTFDGDAPTLVSTLILVPEVREHSYQDLIWWRRTGWVVKGTEGVRSEEPVLYRAMVAWLCLLATGAPSGADVETPPDLLRLGEFPAKWPPLPTWGLHDRLLTVTESIVRFAEEHHDHRNRDWIVVAVLRAAVALATRRPAIDGGRHKPDWPLNADGAENTGLFIAVALESRDADDLRRWAASAVRDLGRTLQTDILVDWHGGLCGAFLTARFAEGRTEGLDLADPDHQRLRAEAKSDPYTRSQLLRHGLGDPEVTRTIAWGIERYLATLAGDPEPTRRSDLDRTSPRPGKSPNRGSKR